MPQNLSPADLLNTLTEAVEDYGLMVKWAISGVSDGMQIHRATLADRWSAILYAENESAQEALTNLVNQFTEARDNGWLKKDRG